MFVFKVLKRVACIAIASQLFRSHSLFDRFLKYKNDHRINC